jgi:hypothetical protein
MAIHLIYFRSRDGVIALPPTDDTPCPPNHERCEANSLNEVDALQRTLQAQTYARCQSEQTRDEVAFAEARERVRSDLTARLSSRATTQYERDFIREYLKLREEKREKYRARFACDTAYLEMRENDKPRNAEELLKESL